LRHTATNDSTLQLLAAANARYARLAQERTAREVAQAQELARMKKQIAARAAAQRRLSIAQAATAAKAAAANRLGLPTDSVTTEATAVAIAAVPAATQPARTAKRREGAVRQSEAIANLGATTESDTTPEEATAFSRPSRGGATSAAEGRGTSRLPAETRRPREEKAESAPALYTVRPGDNLSKLAQTQGVSIEQLKAWNKLTTETVLAGQQLRLVAPSDATALPVAAQTSAPRRAKSSPTGPKLETHTVQPGDTLFSIAKRFGLTLTELKRLNHLASDQVKLGQKLVVGG
jgi:membrane-bound lytic murein transglycosylase D